MNIIKKIKKEIYWFGVPKERRLDYYLQSIVSKHTGFKIDDIEILIAQKTRMKEYNEFNYFEFVYKKVNYILNDGKLKEGSI